MYNLSNEFTKAHLLLDSKNEAYFSGQVVSGKLEFELKSSLLLTSIHVTFLGEAVVDWTEYETEVYNGQSNNYSVPYKGREEYFNFIQYLIGGPHGPAVSFSPGKYSYPFQYQTPHVCPSSFKGPRGKVWYRVLVDFERPGGAPLHDTQHETRLFKIFQLIAPLNLNHDADALRPINLEFEEIYNCCFWESGPLSIQVKVPFSGYCPGQTVPVEVVADNQSNVEVHRLMVTLRERVAYHSQEPRSDYEIPEKVIAKSKKSVIPAHTKRRFIVKLDVPNMIAPNLANCSIIDLGYVLKVEIEVSGCNDGTEAEADFVIGHVPIADTHDCYVHPMRHSLPEDSVLPPALGFVGSATVRYPGYPYGSDETMRPPPYAPSMDIPMPLHGYPSPLPHSTTAAPAPSAPPTFS